MINRIFLARVKHRNFTGALKVVNSGVQSRETSDSAAMPERIFRLLLFWHSGEQHGCLAAVCLILFTEVMDQVTFLQLERDQDVPGGSRWILGKP